MHKLSEILHDLIDAVDLTPNRKGELHALADDAAAVLPPGPEKDAAEVVADVTKTDTPAPVSRPLKDNNGDVATGA